MKFTITVTAEPVSLANIDADDATKFLRDNLTEFLSPMWMDDDAGNEAQYLVTVNNVTLVPE